MPTLTDDRIKNCVVTENMVNAKSSTLPTAAVSKFVENNLTY